MRSFGVPRSDRQNFQTQHFQPHVLGSHTLVFSPFHDHGGPARNSVLEIKLILATEKKLSKMSALVLFREIYSSILIGR